MSDNKADEYMRNAQACMEVAERMSLRKDRERMVQMAEGWRQLARETLARTEE
jgi:hypothetical protein